MKILVPLDGSETAEAVLPFVVDIARRGEADVLLATVVQPLRSWDSVGSIEAMEREEELAKQYLNEQAERLREVEIDARVTFTRGEAAEGIITIAEREGAHLVAIGTHGRSGLTRWLFGSVATRVLEASKTPVLFLHPKIGEDKGTPGPVIRKILVPLDGSDLAASVVPFIEEFARSQGASLVFFSCVSPITTYPGFESAQVTSIGAVMQELQEQAKVMTGRAADAAIKNGLEATYAVTLDSPVSGVLAAAEDLEADLIAIATHGRGGMGRTIMGSVADGVVRRSAGRPVLVLRPGE